MRERVEEFCFAKFITGVNRPDTEKDNADDDDDCGNDVDKVIVYVWKVTYCHS
jgi:hypothetical protein